MSSKSGAKHSVSQEEFKAIHAFIKKMVANPKLLATCRPIVAHAIVDDILFSYSYGCGKDSVEDLADQMLGLQWTKIFSAQYDTMEAKILMSMRHDAASLIERRRKIARILQASFA